MPLMIAWWCKRSGFWTLFDADLLVVSNQITVADAFKNSQLSTLVGDFGVVIRPGCGLRIRMKPVRGDQGQPPELNDGLLPEGWWTFVIERASWIDGNNHEVSRLPEGLFQFLIVCCDEDDVAWDDGVAVQTFRASGKSMCFAHSAFHSQLSKDAAPPPWRQLLHEDEAFPMDVRELRRSLDGASEFIEMKFFYEPGNRSD